MQDQKIQHKKMRGRISFLMRATLGCTAIGLTSLWGLSVSYDITREELLSFLIGTVLLLLTVLCGAVLVVLLIKLPGIILTRLRNRSDLDNKPDDGAAQ